MSASTTSPAPMVCNLDAAGLSSRLARIARVAQRHLRSHRYDGHTLRLRYALEAERELRSILALEHQCCPSLAFDLREADGAIELAIKAPNADGFTAALYDHFRGAASVPARSCAGNGCGCAA